MENVNNIYILITAGIFALTSVAALGIGYSWGHSKSGSSSYKDMRDLAVQFADVNIGFYNQKNGLAPQVNTASDFHKQFQAAIGNSMDTEDIALPDDIYEPEPSLTGGSL